MSLRLKTGGAHAKDRPALTVEGLPSSGVLVSYEPSAHGRVALLHANDLAQQAGVPLTVLSVAKRVPVAGCGQCRADALFWNRARRSLAEEDLAHAASVVGSSPRVDYAVAEGRPARAIGEAADRLGADLIVLPWKPRGRLWPLVSQPIAATLRRTGRWEVIVAGAAQVPDRGSPLG